MRITDREAAELVSAADGTGVTNNWALARFQMACLFVAAAEKFDSPLVLKVVIEQTAKRLGETNASWVREAITNIENRSIQISPQDVEKILSGMEPSSTPRNETQLPCDV